jgi:hypothetical protein
MPNAEVQTSPCLYIISIVVACESERASTALYAYAVGCLRGRQLYAFETPARSCRLFVDLCELDFLVSMQNSCSRQRIDVRRPLELHFTLSTLHSEIAYDENDRVRHARTQSI